MTEFYNQELTCFHFLCEVTIPVEKTSLSPLCLQRHLLSTIPSQLQNFLKIRSPHLNISTWPLKPILEFLQDLASPLVPPHALITFLFFCHFLTLTNQFEVWLISSSQHVFLNFGLIFSLSLAVLASLLPSALSCRGGSFPWGALASVPVAGFLGATGWGTYATAAASSLQSTALIPVVCRFEVFTHGDRPGSGVNQCLWLGGRLWPLSHQCLVYNFYFNFSTIIVTGKSKPPDSMLDLFPSASLLVVFVTEWHGRRCLRIWQARPLEPAFHRMSTKVPLLASG